jgi:hypothetical protein
MKSKAELKKRWEDILQETIEGIPDLYERYNDSIRNQKGVFNSSLHRYYRRLAVLDYLLNHNVASFKENMKKATSFMIELFERYEKGDPIDPSEMHMALFLYLFDPLASGDIFLAQDYAHHMGGRPEIEETYDDEFTLSMGYCLKYATENNIPALKSWLPRLKMVCENPKNKMSEFMGYPLVLEAFAERDLEKLEKAFQVLLAGHKQKCKSSKGPNYGYYFHDSPDADVFVWGIGLVNLCRFYGMNITVSDPMIPEELLISSH